MSDLFEEGEFDNCAEVLDDWFNSCNIQGTAQMETIEVVEIMDCMRDIEARKETAKDKRIAELEEKYSLLKRHVTPSELAKSLRFEFIDLSPGIEIEDYVDRMVVDCIKTKNDCKR